MRTVRCTNTRAVALIGLALLVLAACDPNVVIGAKHRPASGSGGAAGLSGMSSGATGAIGGEGGVGGVGGVGGAAEPSAGQGGQAEEAPLFEADHENGSLSQWDQGADDDSGGFYADSGSPSYSTEQAHSGEGSAKMTIDTSGGDRIARLYRRVEDRQAFYSAWFYLAEDHTPGVWWSIFLFRAVEDRNASIDLWSVDLERKGDSELTIALFDHEANETIDVPSQPLIPVKKWFQLQAQLIQEPGQPSQLTLWVDGVEALKLENTTAVPENQPVYWVIGNGGAKMSPTVSTLYVDDARITNSFVAP